jgi:hypothetical protein
MSGLYDAVGKVEGLIAAQGLDENQTRSAISVKAGFLLALVGPETPDDPEKLESLRVASEEVLGQPVSF